MHTQLFCSGKRPWIHGFNFFWLVYPSGDLPNTVFLRIFSWEPHEHPFQSASWCCVMCLNSRNSLWALGNSAKIVPCWAAGSRLPAQPALLAARPPGLIWAASRSIWAPSQDTFKGWGGGGAGRRFSKKGRAWGVVSADLSTVVPSTLIM